MSAQHEHLPPPGYVQALPTIEHGDDIAEGIETIRLTDKPAIVRAMNLIREDSGGPSWPPEAEPLIGKAWEPHLDTIETAIAGLRDDAPAPEDLDTIERLTSKPFCYLDGELYTFCNGEHTAMEAMRERSDAMRLAGAFLDDFFEGWSRGVPEQ